MLTKETLLNNDSCYEFDAHGRILFFKDVNGNQEWRHYREKYKIIHCKYNVVDKYGFGNECWRVCGNDGIAIFVKWNNGRDEWFDEKGFTTQDPVKILLLSNRLYNEMLFLNESLATTEM